MGSKSDIGNILKKYVIVSYFIWLFVYLMWMLTDHSDRYYSSFEMTNEYSCYLLVKSFISYFIWSIEYIFIPLVGGWFSAKKFIHRFKDQNFLSVQVMFSMFILVAVIVINSLSYFYLNKG